MNIRSPAAERIDHQYVDQTDDRCVLTRACKGREIDLVVLFNDLKFLLVMSLKVKGFKRYIEVGSG